VLPPENDSEPTEQLPDEGSDAPVPDDLVGRSEELDVTEDDLPLREDKM
jgi:hypothetical protein